MPRNRRARTGGTGGGTDAALLAADRVLQKESDYRNGVKRIQAAVCLLAERIAIAGDVESALLHGRDDSDEDNGASEAATEFLSEQRNRLKDVAEGNSRAMKDIDTFLAAVEGVRDEVLERSTALEGGDQEEEEEECGAGHEDPPDYERSIVDRIKEAREEALEGVDLQDDEFCREVRKRLGEKEPKKRKKGRRSKGGADEEEEEELEVLNNRGDDEGLALKCPFTGMLFEDPVKNKNCGHTYSRAGFMQLMRTKGKHNCPVPGCPNQGLSKSQVEEDVEMAMKVRRHKMRLERQQEQQRVSQELDDDEYDDEDGNGMTVVE